MQEPVAGPAEGAPRHGNRTSDGTVNEEKPVSPGVLPHVWLLTGFRAGDKAQMVALAEALGWPLVWDQDQETAIRAPYGGPKVTWGGPPVHPRTGRNRLRFALAADGDLETEIGRLVSLGAIRLGDAGPGAVAMADPDGNEFSVQAPGDRDPI